MGNQFTDYLTMINSYSKEDIQLQLLLSLVASLAYILVLKLILKKISVTTYNKSHICCGFVVALIYNIVTPYLNFSFTNTILLNLLINLLSKAVIMIFLLYVEKFIIDPLFSDKSLKKKVLIWQGISILVFNIVFNMVVLFIIVLYSSLV